MTSTIVQKIVEKKLSNKSKIRNDTGISKNKFFFGIFTRAFDISNYASKLIGSISIGGGPGPPAYAYGLHLVEVIIIHLLTLQKLR